MIDREIAEPVIQYLRTLTRDGELSSDDVWELANWLNQQPERTLESWPAKSLVSVLQTSFEDKELSDAEMEELAIAIVEIEETWKQTFPPVIRISKPENLPPHQPKIL